MRNYELDYYGFSNEDGDGCMAVFVGFPDVKGVGDTYDEARIDAYEQLDNYFKFKEKEMTVVFDRAIEKFEEKNYDEAYGLFEKSSEQNPKAMVNLAIMHMKGQGCKQSNTSAKKWFELAAQHKHPQALNSLAIFYEKGMDGVTDKEKSFEYYQKAADVGHVDAQVKTGMLLRESGKHAEAMKYLIAAAHNNNPQAQSIITYVSNKELGSKLNEPFRSFEERKQRELVLGMIEKNIMPTLASDEGGIELVNYVSGDTINIWLNYQGACSGCHLGSTSTADMLLDNFETLIDKNVVLYLM